MKKSKSTYKFLYQSKYLKILPILSLLFLTSCTKLVTIPPPTDRLVTPSVFNNNESATAAILNLYWAIGGNQAESYYMSLRCGLLADELKNFSPYDPNLSFYANAMTATNSNGIWTTSGSAYNYIYQSNAIIEGLVKYSGVDPSIKKQLTGEALFMRAFWLFYLANCYGDVPLPLATEYNINAALKRTKRTDVYQQSINDLKQAEGMLNSEYVDATDTTVTTDRVRPTSWAAKAMLARVYLYSNKYDSAEAEATAVINNTSTFSLLADLNGVFLANSPEAIWQVPTQMPHNFCTAEGSNFILIAAPTNVTVSPQLLASFETGDARKTSWIGSIVPDGLTDTFYFPYKYKEQYSLDPTAPPVENVMVLRFAEQYLIRAEARAQQNNLAGAVEDLNIIRHRAGLNDYSGTLDQPSMLNAILHERQVELFTEWGHRWFDLARTGNINQVMSIVAPEKGTTWNPDGHQQLFPIPQSEIQADYNLTQNAGY